MTTKLTLEQFHQTHKYHFEQAVKIANFSEIGRLKDLMKRTDLDIARVSSGFYVFAFAYVLCVCIR